MGWWGVRVGIQTCFPTVIRPLQHTGGWIAEYPNYFPKNPVFSCISILAAASGKWTTFNFKLLLLQKHITHGDQHQQSCRPTELCGNLVDRGHQAGILGVCVKHWLHISFSFRTSPHTRLNSQNTISIQFFQLITFCKEKPSLTFYAKRL